MALTSVATTPAPEHPAPVQAIPEFIIEARRGWIGIDWAELINYRELLYFLVWRDVKVRYKQTVLGVAWAVLQPVFSMVVFTVIFGHFAKMDSDGKPYAVFVYAALLPWTFFSNAVTQAAQSLISQQHLLTKVYFPRMFVPVSAVGAGLVDFAISFGVYACILAWYHQHVGWGLAAVPLLSLLAVVAAVGFGTFLAALTVSYRDFKFVVPFMMQIWMYASPVIYSAEMLPAKYRSLLALNPLTGIIGGFRSAILGSPWDWRTLAVSAVTTLGTFVLGLFYFRKTERRFADIA